ncbi:mycofactocin biosynthesis peptidyl-dipeptidase MftE [Nocardioides sp. AX2bis]|uniref:mycofactocin biosynthesis peptidyl-dipeptidase MftE n=1 Tax=Nocardioides sp. AX2bis TaxID=2653157 RepID=UPI0012F1CCB7|nr:mycofactocin biosynthesis peptidyl-dipeptidase MftE [Nocardioides sp. AX2bis]VXC57248.1 Putative mycofactocin system creatinine amidohydrolase family protein MftE [Nocardioides sp. AX2bis]
MQHVQVTSAEVAGTGVVLVPVGSTEQHGPHLPLGTDTLVATAVADTLAARLASDVAGGCWVAPPVAYGSSGEHQSFPGTLSVGTDVLRTVLVELVRSARTWCDRVVLVNGHGGNLEAVRGAVEQMTYEGHRVDWVPCAVAGADAHAGRTETSLMLHLHPDAVRPALAEPGCTTPVRDLLPALRAGGVAAVSPNGVLGDPTGASAAEGERLLAAMVDGALARLAVVA